ncbi:MAG: L,D-transpeptidase [Gemmatimonadaceae bacterium]
MKCRDDRGTVRAAAQVAARYGAALLLVLAPAVVRGQGDNRRADSVRLAAIDSMLAQKGAAARVGQLRAIAVRESVVRDTTRPDTVAGGADSAALGVHGAPRSEADSLDWIAARDVADRARGFRVVVSLFDRRLWVIRGTADTILAAPVSVAKRTTLSFEDRSWTFDTPRGRRVVLSKVRSPMWTPPVWHYAEVAKERGLRLAYLRPDSTTWLSDGSQLVVRRGLVGVARADAGWMSLPTDEEIVFDSTLFIPPVGSRNRRVEGELGRFRLDLGDGYLLHGTPHLDTIGDAATHGCIRLRDDDIAWLYKHVPTGTRVFIY